MSNTEPAVTVLEVELNAKVRLWLGALLATGLYGRTLDDVALRLIERGIEERLSAGILDREKRL